MKTFYIVTSSVDPDEMQHFGAFHLGLHCLQKYLLWGFRYSKGWHFQCHWWLKSSAIVISCCILEVYRKPLDPDQTAAYGTVPQIQRAIKGLCCYGIIVFLRQMAWNRFFQLLSFLWSFFKRLYCYRDNNKVILLTHSLSDQGLTSISKHGSKSWSPLQYISRTYLGPSPVPPHLIAAIWLLFTCNCNCSLLCQAFYFLIPHPIAQSVASLPADQGVGSLIQAWSHNFRGDWSWNNFYGHSSPSADSRNLRVVVSYMCLLAT